MVKTCPTCGIRFDRAPQARTCSVDCRNKALAERLAERHAARSEERIELLLGQAQASGAAKAALAKGDLQNVDGWMKAIDELNRQYLALI